MKLRFPRFNLKLLTIFLCGVLFGTGCGVANSEIPESTISNPAGASEIDREILDAIAFSERVPASPSAFNALAVVYIKKARRTGDISLNSLAENAVARALEIDPENPESLKLSATLDLAGHRFDNALATGTRLLNKSENDWFTYAILTDANAELGNYPEAVRNAQKLADLKPGSAAYARAGYMRFLHGEPEGAVEMYKLAAQTADPVDKEAQSWCLVQLGNVHLKSGQIPLAEAAFDEALQNLPGYYLALDGKGRALVAKGELRNAEGYLKQAQERFPQLDTVLLLGDVYTKLGEGELAKAQYDLAQNEEKLGDHYDEHRLALYWADNDINLDRALEVAEEDYGKLKDIYGADTLAWCLYKKGRYDEAKQKITEAMRLKTNDSRIYYHAGMIELALKNRSAARAHLEKALSLNPSFDILQADLARKSLERLK